MSDYPLSTVSSKKIKKTSRDLLDKSACQLGLPPPPDKSSYEHILKGERLFIELYYQGKVLQTEYNKYVQFMGGTLYRRLNPKVTILLTNTEEQELANILERVRKICPQCKVVSILWFEMSFQNKCKMPFDDYLLQKTNQTKEKSISKKEAKIEDLHLEAYFQNISEDTQIFYKDYFAKNKNKTFQYANNKKEKLPPHYYLPAQEFQMPPIPKKKAQKTESIDKKPRKTHRATTKLPPNKEVLQTKANKSDKTKNTKEQRVEVQKVEQAKLQKHQKVQQAVYQTESQENYHFNRGGLNSIMQKYLMNGDSDNNSLESKAKCKEVSVKSVSEGKQSSRALSMNEEASKRVRKQSQCKQSLQKLAITPRYKDIKFMSTTEREAEKMLALQKLKLQLSKNIPNRLLVVSNSKRLLEKVEQCNKQYEGGNFLFMRYIDYETYWQYMQGSSINKHQAYFPINQRRAVDRPLYFALKTNFAHAPKLVGYGIVKQVAAFNKKTKDRSQETEFTVTSFKVKDKIELICCQEIMKGKKITFMQSQLGNQQLQFIVNKLGGRLIEVSNFINDKVDLVITSRNHIKKNDSEYLTQQQLWQKIFPLQPAHS